MKKTTLIYLATPYSDTDTTHSYAEQLRIQSKRAFAACRAAGELMCQGFAVFSPISHGHHIAKVCGIGTDYESWREQDEEMIRRCDVVVLLLADGADKSAGMLAESRFAMEIGKPVREWDGVSKLDLPD